MTVRDLLESVGLAEYAAAFEANAVTEDLLPELTSEDLREIGVAPLGHRKRILAAIAEAFGAEAAEGADAQRRQVSVLFADLVGSTALSQQLDAEDLRELMRAYHAAAKDAIERYGGHVAQYLGDGVLAYFGFPQAHEDDAERSVRAGLDVIAALAEVQVRIGARLGIEVRARVGIETGPVVVGDLLGDTREGGYSIVGETPNLAARLQGVAAPGAVVVGPRTRRLLPGRIQLRPLEPQSLKGVEGTVEAWRVDGLGLDGASLERARRRGAFVGRRAELAALEEAFSRVRSGGRACVHVIGEAGMGKSRLVAEFLDRAPRATRVLAGHCSQYEAATLHPFAAMLARRAATQADATGLAQPEALRRDIEDLGDGLAADAPYLLRLAGFPADVDEIDADLLGVRTQEALADLVGAIGRIAPTVLFVNDLHWIDERSEELLDDLARRADLDGVMLLCTHRPDYAPPWIADNNVRMMELGPLAPGEVEALYRSAGRAGEIDIAALVDRSGGNPLFVEEIAASAARRASGGSAAASSAIPSSLSGLLLERVDQLSPRARRLLRAASVIGRRFDANLAMVAGAERDLALAELRESGLLIDEHGDGRALRFKHVLVQDAVYDSLLQDDRRALHAKVAHRLEDLNAGAEDAVAEDLARHFEHAGEALAAARYAYAAGRKALELFALRDASRWFERSRRLFPPDLDAEDERLRARMVGDFIQVICWEARFDEMRAVADAELPRIRALGADPEVSRILSFLGEAYLHVENFDRSARILEEALTMAEALDDSRAVGLALAETAWLRSITVPPEDREALDALVARLRALSLEQGDRLGYAFAANADWANAIHEGRVSDARAVAEDLVAYGETSGYPPALSWGGCFAGYTAALFGDAENAAAHCDRAAAAAESPFDRLAADLCRAMTLVETGRTGEALDMFDAVGRDRSMVGSFFFAYASPAAHGRALAAEGRAVEAVEGLERAAARFAAIGHRRGEAMSAAALGEVLLLGGEDVDAAGHALARAEDAADRTGMAGLAAWCLALRARAARRIGDVARAESHIARARDLAAPLGWPALSARIDTAAEA